MLKSIIGCLALACLFLSPPLLAEPELEKEEFPERFRLKVGVDEVSTRMSKTIVFRIDKLEGIDPESWAFYIFSRQPHFENLQQFPRGALRILMGLGRVPHLMSWDCKTKKGTLVPPGKYYLILWIKDTEGKRWLSYWQSFKVD